jgi:hypothetical protein
MAQSNKALAELRQHERVKTTLLGRYMLTDGREAKCTVTDVSAGGVALTAPNKGVIGERVILYIDQIGRVEGKIARHLDDGFALQLEGSGHVAERIARRLEEVRAAGELNPSPERRDEPRIKLDDELAGKSVDDDGRRYQVVDLSFTGADVKIAGERPPVGAFLQVGKFRARVVRHTDAGVAVVFLDPPTATLGERLAGIT